MIDPGAMRNVFMQHITGMMDIAKQSATSQTKTTETLGEALKSAQSSNTQKNNPVEQRAAVIVGGLLGKLLAPFVFNPEKARNELQKEFPNFDLKNADEKTIKSMRNDLRTVKAISEKCSDANREVLEFTLDHIKAGTNETFLLNSLNRDATVQEDEDPGENTTGPRIDLLQQYLSSLKSQAVAVNQLELGQILRQL